MYTLLDEDTGMIITYTDNREEIISTYMLLTTSDRQVNIVLDETDFIDEVDINYLISKENEH